MKKTKSLCPECLKVIPAQIYEEKGKIMIEKECPEHGSFKDVYWSDKKLYDKFSRWSYQGKPEVFNTQTDKGCPFDCGLCPEHKSSTMLGLIDLTNRCNQKCPMCFANSAAAGYLYEPTLEEIRMMLELFRKEKPPCPAIQFSGGEPTVRENLPQIIKMAKEMGFIQIQIATNGVKLARDIDFCRKLKEAGLNTIYLQFDGVTEEPYRIIRGYNALPNKLKAIQNCSMAGLKSIVLVPTLIKGINDHEVGDIVRFAVKNLDVVRGVNFQPVSFEGRVENQEREKGRITIPDLLKLLEKQTNKEIPASSFYPVPFVVPFSKFIEGWKGKKQFQLSVHPHCGAATYVVIEKGKFLPITEFINVEKLIQFLDENAEKLDSKLKKGIAIASLANILRKFIKRDKVPEGFNVVALLADILGVGNRQALANFHRKAIFIGAMHFMDPYNFDLQRVQRCGIHYATPDKRIIPFCSYNAIHRPIVEKKFAKPL